MLKVGTLTTSVGGSYLWQALKRPFQSQAQTDRDLLDAHVRNAVRIVERSTELKGAFMKLVQMLSMRNDLLPPAALEVLSTVQSSVPPMDAATIREQITRELGAPPEQLFAEFEPEAFAAASLGQVHRARLPSGEAVVVKIQYPGVEETVVQDLKNIRALLADPGADRARRDATEDRRHRGRARARGAPARGARLRERGGEPRALPAASSPTIPRS